jgi:hypothetical protein
MHIEDRIKAGLMMLLLDMHCSCRLEKKPQAEIFVTENPPVYTEININVKVDVPKGERENQKMKNLTTWTRNIFPGPFSSS